MFHRTHADWHAFFLEVATCQIDRLLHDGPHLWHPAMVSKAIVCTYCATGIPTEWWNCSCKMSPSSNDPIKPCAFEIAAWQLKNELPTHWGISVASQTRNVDGWHECSSLTWCNIDVRFTPWCCFEPETSDIDYALHMFKGNFIPGETWLQHNTVNAKESIQDPIRLACDHGAIAEQSWKLYSKTTWKISTTFGGSGLFFRWKENYLSCHLKSWFGPRSHFITFAHHVITLKDKRIEHSNPPQTGRSGVMSYN